MHELELINPVEVENWNNLLLSTAGYSFFHTANWADVLSRSYGYRPVYFTAGSKDRIDSLLAIMEVKSLTHRQPGRLSAFHRHLRTGGKKCRKV